MWASLGYCLMIYRYNNYGSRTFKARLAAGCTSLTNTDGFCPLSSRTCSSCDCSLQLRQALTSLQRSICIRNRCVNPRDPYDSTDLYYSNLTGRISWLMVGCIRRNLPSLTTISIHGRKATTPFSWNRLVVPIILLGLGRLQGCNKETLVLVLNHYRDFPVATS